jgi:hypothetical protein
MPFLTYNKNYPSLKSGVIHYPGNYYTQSEYIRTSGLNYPALQRGVTKYC